MVPVRFFLLNTIFQPGVTEAARYETIKPGYVRFRYNTVGFLLSAQDIPHSSHNVCNFVWKQYDASIGGHENWKSIHSWWRCAMETLSIPMAVWEGNPPLTDNIPSHRLWGVIIISFAQTICLVVVKSPVYTLTWHHVIFDLVLHTLVRVEIIYKTSRNYRAFWLYFHITYWFTWKHRLNLFISLRCCLDWN